ncbi:MAG TPA: tRNA lysidine(34) synthetase TilS, partial [Candidatus Luteococcus avicola]|nr:tRNA lysidine(34) synthetase TilS [Candidatus Luteococcus avicola]
MARRALSAAQLAVVQAVRSALLEDGRPLSVGLSGGADSWALAAAVAHLGLPARVVVVDHQLQPGSGELAATVAERAKGLGLNAEVVAVEVLNSGEGLEAAARSARLAALCQPGTTVLLGHTLDDQAEQVLLGLARGSGAASLQGIAPVAA